MLVLPGWASRATILLVMQTEDDHMHVRLGRHLTTLFRRGLVSHQDAEAVPAHIKIAHDVVYNFAAKTDGAAAGSVAESLLNTPMTAHIMGGVSFGRSADEGVIDLDCQVFNYPGLSVADNSIIPANPGVNPSLTCTALAEYAMSRVPAKPGHFEPRL
jgi:cholesterol oxidase